MTLGDLVFRIHGGCNRYTGQQSHLDIHSIIATHGVTKSKFAYTPPLSNQALFRRDHNMCMLCGFR